MSRRVDLHLYEPLPDGTDHYGSVVDSYRFPAAARTGRGRIDGVEVRYELPEWSVRWHSGYPYLPLLCARFGLPVPPDL